MDCGLHGRDRAEWLADKIPAYGDYAKEAALVLVQQANEIERMRESLTAIYEKAKRYQCTYVGFEGRMADEIADMIDLARLPPNDQHEARLAVALDAPVGQKLCRICGEPLTEKNGARSCRNGCQIYTAMPSGELYNNARSFKRDGDGRIVETGGFAGNLRRMPTCRD